MIIVNRTITHPAHVPAYSKIFFLNFNVDMGGGKKHFELTLEKRMYIFLTHSSSGNFAETRDGLDSRGADRHRVSPNHPKFHQNSPRAVDEWGNGLFLMF